MVMYVYPIAALYSGLDKESYDDPKLIRLSAFKLQNNNCILQIMWLLYGSL